MLSVFFFFFYNLITINLIQDLTRKVIHAWQRAIPNSLHISILVFPSQEIGKKCDVLIWGQWSPNNMLQGNTFSNQKKVIFVWGLYCILMHDRTPLHSLRVYIRLYMLWNMYMLQRVKGHSTANNNTKALFYCKFYLNDFFLIHTLLIHTKCLKIYWICYKNKHETRTRY